MVQQTPVEMLATPVQSSLAQVGPVQSTSSIRRLRRLGIGRAAAAAAGSSQTRRGGDACFRRSRSHVLLLLYRTKVETANRAAASACDVTDHILLRVILLSSCCCTLGGGDNAAVRLNTALTYRPRHMPSTPVPCVGETLGSRYPSLRSLSARTHYHRRHQRPLQRSKRSVVLT